MGWLERGGERERERGRGWRVERKRDGGWERNISLEIGEKSRELGGVI